MKTFLICDDELHAEVVDQLVAQSLREAYGTTCTAWSGVYTDGTRFGILWAAPASDVYGLPEEGESLLLAEEVLTDGVSNWQVVPPPEPVLDEVI